jgi:hypothetical protein
MKLICYKNSNYSMEHINILDQISTKIFNVDTPMIVLLNILVAVGQKQLYFKDSNALFKMHYQLADTSSAMAWRAACNRYGVLRIAGSSQRRFGCTCSDIDDAGRRGPALSSDL